MPPPSVNKRPSHAQLTNNRISNRIITIYFNHSSIFATQYLTICYFCCTFVVVKNFRLLGLYVLFLCCAATPLCAASKAATPVRVGSSFAIGTMLRGSIADEWLGNRPPMGGELSVEFLPTGKWKSLQEWNNASVGLAVDYINLTNAYALGDAIAPYAFLKIPVLKRPHFILGVRPGLGISFVTKTYYNTVAPELSGQTGTIRYPTANGAIGSHTNAYFAEALYMEFPIRAGWSLYASYGWYHISNGSIRQPNSGYNMFNGMVGVLYQPNEENYIAPQSRVPHGLYPGKQWEIEMSVSGGVRQAYFADKNYFGVGRLSLVAFWRALSIFRLGGGIDVFYDGYYKSVCDEFAQENNSAPVTYFAKTYLHESNPADCWRIGLSIQPEFIIGNLSVGFHCGVYLYDNVKNLEPYSAVADNAGTPLKRRVFYAYNLSKAGIEQDGWLYTGIMLKYRCTKHLFVQLGMKAHLTKVEFIDAGLGLCF